MSIAESIESIKERISKAAVRCGRNPDDVKLMAVSKFHRTEEILEACACGITLFGENRVQETCEKFPTVLAQYPTAQVQLIGSLQRNKVKQILPIVTCIQSVDRLELLQEIEKRAQQSVRVLFEVHTGEESKSGFINIDDLVRAIEFSQNAEHIVPAGFMTMAPLTDDTAVIRSSFVQLRKIADDMRSRFPHENLQELSMGMSGDFEIAIEEGSTLVRVGTAIFGARHT